MTTATHPPTIETSATSITCPDWCAGTCEWEGDATNQPVRWHEVAESWGHGVYAGCEERPACSTCQAASSLTNWQVRISDTDSLDSMDATKARELAAHLLASAEWVEQHEATA